MIFKRTPAIEASLIYGVALILGFLIFAAFGGWQEAANLSKGMAFLIQFPTWVIMVVVGIFNKKATKYGRFFANISVISAVALIFIGIIYYLSSGAKGTDVTSIQATFNWDIARAGLVYAMGQLDDVPADTVRSSTVRESMQ